MPRRLASLLLVLVAVAAAALAAAPAGLARGLPLGLSGLSETRSTHALAPGVRLTRIVRGHAFRGDRYTVSIDLVATRAPAVDLARRLRADGFEAAVTRVRRRAPDDPRPGPLGWLVRSGAFDTETQATALRDWLAAAGYDAARVDFTGEDGRRTTGPWRVAILALDPRRFEGRIGPALATGIVPGAREAHEHGAPHGRPRRRERRLLRGHGRGRHRGRPGRDLGDRRGAAVGGGQRVRLRRSLGVVNGGPRLVRAGRPDITAFAEGFVWPEDPEFFWRFGVRRNPRTMAGVTGGGRLLLVTVDGHAPGYSLGLSFREEARVMPALGARDAVNLDGGGSTTMAVRGRLVNLPSDDTGERPVGDALLLTP